MNKKILFVVQLLFVATAVILATYRIYCINTEIHYYIQQPVFLTDGLFFQNFVSDLAQLSLYGSNFITQFFSDNLAGSLLVVGISLLIGVLFYWSLRNIHVHQTPLVIVILPLAIVVALMQSYMFPFVIVVRMLVVAIFVLLGTYTIKRWIGLLFNTLMALLVYYVAGSIAFYIFMGSVVVMRWGTGNIKKSIAETLVAILLGYAVPVISYNHIFNISAHEAWYAIVPDLAVRLIYAPSQTLSVFIYFMPAVLVFLTLARLLKKRFDKLSINWLSNNYTQLSVQAIFITSLWYYADKNCTNVHKNNIAHADYYCNTKEWDKAIDVALSDTEYDFYMNFYYNRAIDNTGKMVAMYFNYPQLMGADALYPDKLSASTFAMNSSDLNYDLGFIGESQHWAYEALTSASYSPRVLERLVVTNLIYRNYMGAEKLLQMLSHNIVCNTFVNKYKPMISDTSLASKDPEIALKRRRNPEDAIIYNEMNGRYLSLLDKDSTNQRAYEHFLLYNLLNHRLMTFYKHLSYSKRFYAQLPPLFTEAYVFSSVKLKNTEPLNLNINNASLEIFRTMTKILVASKYDKDAAKPELSYYNNTYLYYMLYLSPLVTKASIKKERLRTTY